MGLLLQAVNMGWDFALVSGANNGIKEWDS